jgi:hypothetical protein
VLRALLEGLEQETLLAVAGGMCNSIPLELAEVPDWGDAEHTELESEHLEPEHL